MRVTGMPTATALLAAGSIAQMACRVVIGKTTLVSTARMTDQGEVRVKPEPRPRF
jgi:hypothetical protein